ncbi:hypothetical protein IM807_02260 [Mycoplasma sp. 'Moose RK']|nr:hypothetical protein [Mycoplasma sp. 'Moose RK']
MVNFIGPLMISKDNINGVEIDVFETINPKNNMPIRLEINKEILTVFAGENTLFFELNKKIPNEFHSENDIADIFSLLWQLDLKINKIKIKYDLFLGKIDAIDAIKIDTYYTNLEFLDD